MEEILAIIGDLEVIRRMLSKQLMEAQQRIAELEARVELLDPPQREDSDEPVQV